MLGFDLFLFNRAQKEPRESQEKMDLMDNKDNLVNEDRKENLERLAKKEKMLVKQIKTRYKIVKKYFELH